MAADMSEYAFAPELLLERMQVLYDAMCVLDLTHNRATQVKYPAADTDTPGERHMAYSSALTTVVSSVVCDEDKPMMLSSLQPDAIRAALSTPESLRVRRRRVYRRRRESPSFPYGYAG